MTTIQEIKAVVKGIDFEADVEAVLDLLYGRKVASAAKRGRNPKFPFVPVIKNPDIKAGAFQTYNPNRGVAFATREEAVAEAQSVLDYQRAHEHARLHEPQRGRLREYYGLPKELPQ